MIHLPSFLGRLALVASAASVASPAAAGALRADFHRLSPGEVRAEIRWPDWTLSPHAPEGTRIAVEDDRLVLQDDSQENAAVLSLTGDASREPQPVEIRFSLRVDAPAREAGDPEGSAFAFLRFGPAYGEDLGFLRVILPGDAAEAGRAFVDASSGDELVRPSGSAGASIPLAEPVDVVLRLDPAAGTYAVRFGGEEVLAGATLAGGVEPRLGVFSVHTPSRGRAGISLGDLVIEPVGDADADAAGAAPAWPTRAEPRPELLSLLNDVDLRGGRLVETPGFDLQDEGAEFQFQPHLYYWPVRDEAGITAWRSEVEKEWIGRHLYSLRAFPVESNRRYVVSALVKSRFDRANNEIDLGLEMLTMNHERLPAERVAGLPADTASDPDNVDGWVRWEYAFVTANYDEPVKARFILRHNIGYTDHEAIDLRLAQVKLIELPVEPHAVEGDGSDLVTFRGGPGNLPMAVESVEEDGGVFTVRTTGVKFTIDTDAGRIAARQRIDFRRDLFDADLSLPLAGLQLVRHDDTVAVLRNEHLAIGVQCDGMAAVAPLSPMAVLATARIGGAFNRLGRGSVYAGDDFGGFAINTYPVIGSGTTVDFEPVTSGLWFEGLARNDTETMAAEGEASRPGWQIRWDLKPGERIFLSGFPCRPFDWERSFSEHYQLTHRENEVEGYDDPWYDVVDVLILWDFHQRSWGMAFADNYTPYDAELTQEHIRAIQAEGMKVMPYNSAWFHRTRDPEVWVESARRMVEDEGFEGMYSDGLPAVEWLVGYEEMRMLREGVLPDGPIRVHDSLPQSGRHVAEYAPYVYTYASTTYQAEHVSTDAGPGWPWVRYVINSWRQSNAIGDIKGDKWRGFGGDTPEQQTRSRLAGFIWNARPGSGAPNYMQDVKPVWDALEADWREHGDDPFYYDRHYLPLAQELTGFRIGRAAMPIVAEDGDQVELSTKATGDGVAIRYTLDGSEPTAASAAYDGPVALPEGATLKAVTLAEGLEPSAVAVHPLPED
ncbi:chitobiase/beta-hexosaminidase C-terminal domain-containing protein [Phycisphaera mikurensis]|uniref:GH29D-like beta-sandwich domain-containing protein n=1 Tax=Phycisphaera mikurensis (strain NBRC 102666 / KCTC 22515 / FYK2301M01) TaxID=1142394 RepID=I0ICR5_PHYMF|nr:chitobiase/beta-hexosaminidase C-terminal domain-containing protein [Phycisphaera mikurensis]MBB6442074.1 hypothetical protein [Phycisphaera mikurensis]BAM03053.1 hypothetical protein PSMK_08940 [Phycisphaera mikurensis NBRC 102666]